MNRIFADFSESRVDGPSALQVTWDTANDLVLGLGSFEFLNFRICFIQDILPFYR